MKRIYVTDIRPGMEISDGETVYRVKAGELPVPECKAKPRYIFVTSDKEDVYEYMVTRKVIVTNQ